MTLLNQILETSIKKHTSDIHIQANKIPVFRVNGDIEKTDFPMVSPEEMEAMLVQMDTDMEFFKQKKHYDGTYQLGRVRFRVHAYKTSTGDAVALRPIPLDIPRLQDIALPSVMNTLADFHNGLVLVTGVTGSGKSTTLAALIQQVNDQQRKHIITVENPIEFVYPEGNCIIHQREIGKDVFEFSDAIRDAMREDPDILLVGELRDLDTIHNAVSMSETGHLVFGTLHAKSAAETSDRLIDVFPAGQQAQIRSQLANALQAVVAQRLIPRKGGGRVPLCEIMVVTDAIRGQIREGGHLNAIRDQIMLNHAKNGSQTFAQSAANLYRQGLITWEIALAHSGEREDVFTRLVQA